LLRDHIADKAVLQNGNYPDPSLTSALPIKRQHRDPYGEWWDPIEKRNYGETVHEDNDILGVFSPDEYTHFKPGWGAVLFVRIDVKPLRKREYVANFFRAPLWLLWVYFVLLCTNYTPTRYVSTDMAKQCRDLII
jgi:hypothetical protein